MPIDNQERERRRACLMAHFQAENQHDIPGTMKTFAETTEMVYNGQIFRTHDQIAQAHAYIGFSGDGAFEGLTAIIDRESFTEDEVVIESRVVGRHVREFQGFQPSGRQVELPAVGFYRFDRTGRLTSERIVMNLGTLGALPTWQPK